MPTMTAGDLLAAHEAGRTQHMETRPVRGDYDPAWGDNLVRNKGKVVTQDILVIDAEVEYEGEWRKLEQIGTDANDETKPVFLDVVPRTRVLDADGLALNMDDMVNVRGLTS